MLIVPGEAGEIGVLARHAPLVAMLKAGSTRVYLDREREEVREFATGPGFFTVEQDRALALVDDAVDAKEIDDERARRQLEEAQAELERVEARRVRSRPLAARAADQARREPALGRRALSPTSVRVAALADVHGNAPALEAVLADVEREAPDLVVFCGDLTWGPLPEETLALVAGLGARFVRGNAERELVSRFAELGDDASERTRFLVERHDAAARAFVRGFEEAVVVDVDGLGLTPFLPRVAAQRRGARHRGDARRARARAPGRRRGTGRRHRAHPCQLRACRGRREAAEPRQRRPALRGPRGARTGRCSGRGSSTAAPSTTSTTPSAGFGRARTRSPSSRWSSCARRPHAPRRSSTRKSGRSRAECGPGVKGR